MKFMTFDDLEELYGKLTPAQMELFDRIEALEDRLSELMKDVRNLRREIEETLDA